jgi:ribosome recycling factor
MKINLGLGALVVLCGVVEGFAFCAQLSGIQTASRHLVTNSHAFEVSPRHQIFHPFIKRGAPLFMAVEAIDEITLASEEKMMKSMDSVMNSLATIRTGRANAAILDRVMVEYYGAPTPLNQLASISVASAQQLTVDPYDKSAMGAVEKGITEADLGIMPSNDGALIRLNIPSLTEERRKELLKQCKGLGEEGKVALRNIRRDGVDKLKKLEKCSDISKDQSADGQDEMQKLIDKYVKDIDGLVSKKEKEVMTV